jgi:uncharacterized protein YjdB
MKRILYIFSALIFTGYLSIQAQAPIIADHTIATLGNLQNIPGAYITAAKANLHIAYEHASHGSQITEGMTGLVTWKGSTYSFSKGGGSGILDYRDHDIEGWADLGNLWEPKELDFEAWEPITRTYLARNPDINVIMWSWCTELSYDATEANVNTYLSLMSGLEEDYPNVKFIYQTGHVDGNLPTSNLYVRNAQIRNFCIANNKILFDFADIESYDPDGNFYANKRVTDCCNYDFNGDDIVSTDGGDPGTPTGGDRNWALDWQASHTQNVDWYACEASHSYPLNANMKAYAAWWLWARLAGWNGSNTSIPVTGITVTGAGGASTITTDNGTLQLTAIVSPSDASNKNVTWSVTNGTGQATINTSGLLSAVANGTVTAKATANDGSGVSGSLAITISNQVIAVTGITVNGAGGASTITTDNGTLQLTATVSPSDASNKNVTWSVTNGTGQATINTSGLLSAVANGTVTAKATANDGSGVSGSLAITISNQVIAITGITVTGAGGASTITTDNGTLQLTAIVSPSDASNKNVTWSVTNGTGQATINTSGLLSAVANGTITAKATANDGSGVSGSLAITISNQAIAVTGITVTGAGGATTITTYNGTLQLTAAVLPSDASNKNVTWSVTNGTGQATINTSGLLSAVANGTVTAKATANDGSGVSCSLAITISNQVIAVTGITVTGAGGANTITTDNGTLQLIAAVSPSDATNKTVTWSVTNGTGQSTISSLGLLTAVANGTITAKATANDGSGISGTLTITISNQVIPVTGITITSASGSSIITEIGGTLQLYASVLPANATNKDIIWSIINGTGQASINSDGLVTAINYGTVTAKATAKDGSGVTGILEITISSQVIPVSNITVTGADGIAIITTDGGTLQLSAIVLPSNATNKNITWSITNSTGRATINASGLVSALENGTVTAKATANDGSGVYGTLSLTLSNQFIPVSSITVTGASGNIISKGDTLQLYASILPENATEKGITWLVVNGTGQAAINSYGQMIAVAEGTVTVKAAANDGSQVDHALDITIVEQLIKVEAIEVYASGNVTPVINKKNGTLKMVAEVLPELASVQTVKWSVENHTGNASIDENGIVTALSDGWVKAIAAATDGSNASGYCTVRIINQSPVTNLQEKENKEFNVFQSGNKLLINSTIKNIEVGFCSLYTIQGILIHREKVTEETIEIDISFYPPGIYILSLSDGQQVYPLKVVIH